MANSGRCRICLMGEYYWHHTVLSCDEYHKFEPEPISGEASPLTGQHFARIHMREQEEADSLRAGGASTGEQPPISRDRDDTPQLTECPTCRAPYSYIPGIFRPVRSCTCSAVHPVSGTEQSDEAFWKYLDDNAEVVRRWPGWMRGDYSGFASGGTEESARPRIINSGTYGELPAKIRDLELIQPHEWDNMTGWQQRDWLMEHWPAADPSLTPHHDKKMLEAIAEDGLLVTWDKDYKFSFSQVVRLMVEFALEHHQEAQAIGDSEPSASAQKEAGQ